MKIADFRIQTTAPDAPSAGVVGLYANASGILLTQNSAGTVTQVGTQFTGVTTSAAQTGGIAKLATGVVFGGKGSAIATGLANPTVWIPYTFNGLPYYIPAYS
jgi:hypothetical protein